MKNYKLFLVVLAVAGLSSCMGGDGDGEVKTTDTLSVDVTPTPEKEPKAKVIAEKNGLRLTSVEGSPDFPNASLTQKFPTNGSNLGAAGKYTFQYDVANYTLGAQTDAGHSDHCANSAQGQHIHLILNNEPYTAHYETAFEKELADGHYVALSFLSRSYHESIKNGTAYQLIEFTVGKAKAKPFDFGKPVMFYSRPKGEYKGPKETDRVLLDFFLVNTQLAEDGNKVRATINGTDFLLTKWEPVFIEGLPLGDVTIKLELLDKDGNLINAPYNPVERTVKLLAE